ncbi:MAG: imidazole glycerol phosphate synthase subunit HisH [Candidatus Paceibacterota bacterium]|jgi:glutamine amidotransferase
MKKDPTIVIIDSGVGNLWSVLKAVRRFAPTAFITEEKEGVEAADAIILPGVGTFKAGMDGLVVRGLVEPIRAAAERGVPILGICLGAQLLLERGYEFGEHEGLGLISGEVVPFPELPSGVKVPAIGWQEVVPTDLQSAMLFAGIAKPFFYFVHSYVLAPSVPGTALAGTTYGGYAYCATVGQGNVYGTQFHPEKSGEAGLQLIQNFIRSI